MPLRYLLNASTALDEMSGIGMVKFQRCFARARNRNAAVEAFWNAAARIVEAFGNVQVSSGSIELQPLGDM